jgi:enamine deaminase RidA (YjgF/YER057c/UK114 family)
MKDISAFIVLLTMCCVPSQAQTDFLKPDGLAAAKGYTHVVVAHPGKVVFVSGQVANNPQGQLVGKDDLKAQTVQVFENLKTALAAAGATFNDVVKITWYVKAYKPEYLGMLRDVRNQYVNQVAPPASTLVGVTSLFQDDYLIEVDAIAVLPEKHVKTKKK